MEAKARKIDIGSIWRFLCVWTMPAVVFLVALSLCFTALRLDPLVSAMLWVALLIGPGTLLLRWIHDFRRGFDGQDMADIVILLFSAGFAFVSAYLGNEGLTLTYLRKVVFFIGGICFLLSARTLRFSKREALAYGFGSLGAMAAFLVVFAFRFGTTFVGNGATKSLVLNFPNANGLGLALFYTIIGLLFLFTEMKWKLLKIVSGLALVAAYLFLYLTRSRNFLFAGVLILAGAVVLFLLRKTVKGRLGTKLLFLAFVASPLLIVVVYFLYIWVRYPNFFSNGIALSYSGNGKSVLNRVNIWVRAMKLFNANPLFGSYFAATEGLGASQLHNVHIDVFSAFGLCGYFCFFVASFRAYRSAKETGRKLSLVQLLCLGALIGIEFSMFFEGGHLNSTISEFLIIIPLVILKGDQNAKVVDFQNSEILARELPWTRIKV